MEIAAALGHIGGEFSVGVESAEVEVFTERLLDGTDFFFDKFGEDEATSDTTDGNGEGIALGDHFSTLGGCACGLDETVDVGFHEDGDVAFRDIAGEGEGLLGFIDGEEGADKGLSRFFVFKHEGKTKAAAGEFAGVFFAEIAFVEGESGLAVDFIDDVADGFGDGAVDAEAFPSVDASVASVKGIAIKAYGDDLVGDARTIAEGNGLFEKGAITG
jgi:hypothetical protein